LLTVLTVLTALLDCFGPEALILMIRVPLLPSRVNVMSMPSTRGDVWARRRRPASARGDFRHAEFPAKRPAAGEHATARWRSDALPVHDASWSRRLLCGQLHQSVEDFHEQSNRPEADRIVPKVNPCCCGGRCQHIGRRPCPPRSSLPEASIPINYPLCGIYTMKFTSGCTSGKTTSDLIRDECRSGTC